MTTLDILRTYWVELLSGLRVTLLLCAITWVTGLIGGVLLGVAAAKWRWTVGIPTQSFSFILSGVPLLVFLFWMHYPLQKMIGQVIDPFITAATALSILNVFMIADIIRTTITDFPSQYVWAAKVCGLTERETALHIQLPIILRQVLPSILTTEINILQATLFASLISVDELFRVAQHINAQIYRPVQIYSALALFFLAVCLPLHALARWLRVRFTRDLSEQ